MNNLQCTPFIIELSGLPRTGKTCTSEKLYDFFKERHFKIVRTEEPAYLIKNTLTINEIKSMNKLNFNNKTLELSIKSLENAIEKKPEIILMDKGVIDNYFWYQSFYNNNIISKEIYNEKIRDLLLNMNKLDLLYILTVDPKISIKGDYINQLHLEPRKNTTLENVKKMYMAYNYLYNLLYNENMPIK